MATNRVSRKCQRKCNEIKFSRRNEVVLIAALSKKKKKVPKQTDFITSTLEILKNSLWELSTLHPAKVDMECQLRNKEFSPSQEDQNPCMLSNLCDLVKNHS